MISKQATKEWLQAYFDACVGIIVTPTLLIEFIKKDVANHFMEEQNDEK